jgi:hypothetical protein
MNAKIPFQFRILRYIHDSFTGEFLNVGLALYAQSVPFFRVRLLRKYTRITNTFPSADGEHYHRYMSALQVQFDHLVESVHSQQLSLQPWQPKLIDELLAKVLPPDDSSIQFGPTQGGMAGGLDAVFSDLYYRLVETYVPVDERQSRTEHEIWNLFSKPLHVQNVARLLHPTIIHTAKDEIEFEHAWKNGKWNALQPLSFDLQQAGSIQKKARLWLGTNVIFNESPEIGKVYYLLGKPRRDDPTLQKAYLKALDLLGSGEHAKKIEIIQEEEAEEFARQISPQIQADTEHIG